MKYKAYVNKLFYRVIGKYPEKKIQPIGMCIKRDNVPSHPYMWCENLPPITISELMSIPFNPEETHVHTIQTEPCTESEIEEILSTCLYDDGAECLPLCEVTQATENGCYFDIKQN